MSKSLKSIIVLTSICLIVALSLSLVNSITAPIISRQAGDEAQKKLSFMLPGSELEKLEFDTEKYPSVVNAYRDKGGKGFVFELKTNKGYTGGDIYFLTAIDLSGKILKIEFNKYPETRGTAEGFVNLYTNKNIPVTDTLSGATVASGAIKNAIIEASEIFSNYATLEVSDIVSAYPLMPTIMPFAKTKSGDIGQKEIDIPVGAPSSITGIATPSTGAGYIVTARAGEMLLVLGVNSYGKVFYMSDIEGKDMLQNPDYAKIISDVESLESVYKKNHKSIIDLMIKEEIIASEDEAKEVDFGKISSNVVAVYELTNGNAYVACGNGYSGRITVCYVIDEDGNIVDYATLEQTETENSYDGTAYGTEISFNSYADKIKDMTIDTVTDETIMIAGATSTTNGVKAAWNDIKAAYDALSQEVE